MATIGSLVVNLGMNTRDYSRGAEEAKASTNGLVSFVNTLKAGIAGLALTAATLAGVGSIGGSLFRGVELAAEAEVAEVAFGTLLGSAAAAKETLADLSAFAASTPFQMPELTQASRSLIAFGVAQEDLISTLRAVGDVSAGVGAPIAEIAELYGKAKVQGRLFQEDINQLTGRGIPIIQELAKQFGVAESGVRKLVESGAVNFSHLEAAFVSLTSEGGKFAGMMDAQSRTLSGLWSTFGDSLDLILRDIAAGLIEAFDLKGSVESSIAYLEAFRNVALAVVDAIAPLAPMLKVIAVALAVVTAAALAYALAKKAAAIAALMFQAVANPASLIGIGVALAAAAGMAAVIGAELANVTAEAERAAVAAQGIAPAAGGGGSEANMTEAFRAAGGIDRDEVAGWFGSADMTKGFDDLVDRVEAFRLRMEEIRDFRGDGSGTWEWAAKPWLEGLDALMSYEAGATKAETQAFQLRAALRDLARVADELGPEKAAAYADKLRGELARVTGVAKELEKLDEQIRTARGATPAELAEEKAVAAGALPQQAAELRDKFAELDRAKAAAEAAKAIADLEQQAGILAGTMTEADVSIAKMGLEGLVPDETLDRLRELNGEIKQLREAEKLKQLGEQITEQFRTPAEKLSDRLRELEELRGKGLISEDTFRRAGEDAVRDSRGKAGEGPKAIERSSQEGFGVIAARIRGEADQTAKRTADNTRRAADELAALNAKISGQADTGLGVIVGEEIA